MAKHRYDYWIQLVEVTRTSIPSLTKDNDSEKKDEKGGGEEEMVALEKAFEEIAVTFKATPTTSNVPPSSQPMPRAKGMKQKLSLTSLIFRLGVASSFLFSCTYFRSLYSFVVRLIKLQFICSFFRCI